MARRKLCTGHICYNDGLGAIKKMVHSIPVHVTKIFIDGRFPDFPQINGSDYSTDGTIEYLDSLPNTIVCKYADYHTKKSNFLFQKCEEFGFDAVLRLATDEYLEGDWNDFERRSTGFDGPRAYVAFKDLHGDGRNLRAVPRLFYEPGRWSSKTLHWYFYFDDNLLMKGVRAMQPDVKGVTICHDDRARPDSRNDMMTEYQKIPQTWRDDLVEKRDAY